MPECHKCPHNGKRSSACLKCKGPAESNHHGRTFVSVDAGPPEFVESICTQEDLEPEPEHESASVLVWLSALTPRQRDALFLKLKDPSLSMREIGRQTGWSQRTISRDLQAVVESIPVTASSGIRRIIGH
jgi:hypothetical protein